MNRIFSLVIAIILFNIVDVNAQFNSYKVDGNTFKVKKYSDVDGTPYYYERWVKADLYDINGQVLENIDVNYNGLTGKFESIQGEFTYIELNNTLYSKVIVKTGPRRHVFLNLVKYGDQAYYRLIYEGDSFSYFEKHKSKLKKEEIATYGTSSTKQKISNSKEQYILADNILTKVKRSSKEIGKFFRNKSIIKYAKSEKLKLKSDKDLILLLRYCDSLN